MGEGKLESSRKGESRQENFLNFFGSGVKAETNSDDEKSEESKGGTQEMNLCMLWCFSLLYPEAFIRHRH
jgi:hypothetical protein